MINVSTQYNVENFVVGLIVGFLKMDDIKRKRIRDNWATLVAAELVEMSNEWNFEPPRNNTDTPAPENAGNVDYLKRSNNMLLIYL